MVVNEFNLSHTDLIDIGRYNFERILWLEFKACCAGSGYNFSQGIDNFVLNACVDSKFYLLIKHEYFVLS
jgi:hypothetical protein